MKTEQIPAHSGSSGARAYDGYATPAADPALNELGLADAETSETPQLNARSKATAWLLGLGGIVAFTALTLGVITVVDWAIPYLRYLYLLWLGSGSGEF